MEMENSLASILREKLPGMSQAQHSAFMLAFDALCFTIGAIHAGDEGLETEGLKALDQALELSRKATEITDKLRDVPEAATSQAAEEFKKPPAEFAEQSIQQELLSELEDIHSICRLQSWYEDSCKRRDQVKTQILRNALFDAIRYRRLLIYASTRSV